MLPKEVFSQKTQVFEGSRETRVWGRNVVPFVFFGGFNFPSLALLGSSVELSLHSWQCSHGQTTTLPTFQCPNRGFAAHPLYQQATVKQQMPQGGSRAPVCLLEPPSLGTHASSQPAADSLAALEQACWEPVIYSTSNPLV